MEGKPPILSIWGQATDGDFGITHALSLNLRVLRASHDPPSLPPRPQLKR